MNAATLYALGTVLTWVGYALGLRTMFLFLKLVASTPQSAIDPTSEILDPTFEIRYPTVRSATICAVAAALALVILAAATVAAMVFTARVAKARGIARGVVTHLALVIGSVLFGIPFAWLVITSFKEDIDMSSPNGIVWIPRVAVKVPYF